MQSYKDANIRELEKKVDIGIKSPVSPRSHGEIFDSLRKKALLLLRNRSYTS